MSSPEKIKNCAPCSNQLLYFNLIELGFDNNNYCINLFCFSKDEWLAYLSKVTGKLDVRETMELDEDLVKFVDKKRKTEIHIEKVNILEIFECIFPEIQKIYWSKLDSRDIEDEFQVEKICRGVDIEDGMFFNDYFLPSCIFYIYKEWLKCEVSKEDVFEELFVLGSGSKTDCLFPEVLPFCEACASPSEVQQKNLKAFRGQVENEFVRPKTVLPSSDDYSFLSPQKPILKKQITDLDEGIGSGCNPFVCDDILASPLLPAEKTNPFESDRSEDEDEDEELFLDACVQCHQSFPSDDFLQVHMKIFHSHIIKTKFVENGEDLISTFIEEPAVEDMQTEDVTEDVTEDTSNKEVEAVKVNNENARTVKTKYLLRKSLKY